MALILIFFLFVHLAFQDYLVIVKHDRGSRYNLEGNFSSLWGHWLVQGAALAAHTSAPDYWALIDSQQISTVELILSYWWGINVLTLFHFSHLQEILIHFQYTVRTWGRWWQPLLCARRTVIGAVPAVVAACPALRGAPGLEWTCECLMGFLGDWSSQAMCGEGPGCNKDRQLLEGRYSDRVPRGACSSLNLQMHDLPRVFAAVWDQWQQCLWEVRTGRRAVPPVDWALRCSEEVEEHLWVWERGWLMKHCCPLWNKNVN